MEKTILKHLTVTGFVQGDDLTNCAILEKQLSLAKNKLKLAKNDVAKLKKELNTAIENSLIKVANSKKQLKDIKVNEADDYAFSAIFSKDQIKKKYEDAMSELEIKKNELQKKIENYSEDGSEKWDSFKHKLNHDLAELGKALKGFTTHAE